MIVINDYQILKALCKQQQKWGMMMNITLISDCRIERLCDELVAVSKGLIEPHGEHNDIVSEIVRCGMEGTSTHFVFFDTKEELDDAYENRICGDDNRREHGYNGPLGTIYCLTCSPAGETINENT